jgi:hypothetical protein
MPLLISSLGSLGVALLYYAYRDHVQRRGTRQRALRGRVTYMLWKASQQVQ